MAASPPRLAVTFPHRVTTIVVATPKLPVVRLTPRPALLLAATAPPLFRRLNPALGVRACGALARRPRNYFAAKTRVGL